MLCIVSWSCLQQFWARVVMRKWLNMGNRESDYSADPDEDDPDTKDSDDEGEWYFKTRAVYQQG